MHGALQFSEKGFLIIWLQLHHLLSCENLVVEVASRSGRTKSNTKRGIRPCDKFILQLLLPDLVFPSS